MKINKLLESKNTLKESKDTFSVRFNTRNGAILKSMSKSFDNYKDALNYAKNEDEDLGWAIEKNGECVMTGGYGGRNKYHTSWRPNQKSIKEEYGDIEDWDDTEDYDFEAEYNQALEEVTDQLDNYGEEEAAEYLYMNNHIYYGYKDKIAKELGIESEYRKWTTTESKSIKESTETEVLYKKGNQSIIKDGYGFGIDNGYNVNRFTIDNAGNVRYDNPPSKTMQSIVNRLVRQGKFNNPNYSNDAKYVGNTLKYGRGVKESFEKEGGPFWYFTKHGLGPGMLPKGVNVVDTKEDDNYGTYIALDKVLTTQELREYELVEKKSSMEEAFKPTESGIQSVKCYNRYNYTIQELRVDNDNKTFERGNFTAGKADKKTQNRQEYEDIVDSLKELGYTEIKSDYRSLRNKTRKGIPTNEATLPRNASKIRATHRYGDRQSMELSKDGTYWREANSNRVYPSDFLRRSFDIDVLETDSNYKPNRTKPEYVVQGNYGYGWEDLTASANQAEAKADLKAYRENETGVPHRLITRRVPVTEDIDYSKFSESLGQDYSHITEVKSINYNNSKSNLLPYLDTRKFKKALEETGLEAFKIRTTRLNGVSNADLKDEFGGRGMEPWKYFKGWDTSVDGFNEFYFFFKGSLPKASMTESIDWNNLSGSEQMAAEHALFLIKKGTDLYYAVDIACNSVNYGNVEPEYEDEDFYEEEVDRSKVREYVKAQINSNLTESNDISVGNLVTHIDDANKTRGTVTAIKGTKATVCVGDPANKDYVDVELDKLQLDENCDGTLNESPTLSINDLKTFYNTATGIDKEKYPNFFVWYDEMIKSGKYKREDVNTKKNSSSEFYDNYVIIKNQSGDGYDIYSYSGTPENVKKLYLEDEGYATTKDAKAEIDKWNKDSKLDEAVVPSSYEFDDDVDDLSYYYEDEIFNDELENSPYTKISSKSVPDFDGFMTDYTMYMNINTGEYVFILGDNDIYDPSNTEHDWECETKEEAEEWFNTYKGFDEEDDDVWEGYDFNLAEDVEKSSIIHKKSDGSYLVASEDGKSYVAYNKDDACMGNISANNETEAKNKFNSNTFDE